ncbi:hypothetical protein OH768_00950 [Streptomyces sp. NBC_01622]|uniref:hypothetical protein n=1 Tax=Streptomyces sp. NBC_01622 TaxID=2975903 RepID=UPI003864EED0|nr:hypothetical protein OH768_00950 [Streptomyces sp. NBC_01622]
MTRTKKTIKAELRAERGKEHPDEGHLSELMSELERARGGRPRRSRARISPEISADPGGRIRSDEVDQDTEAIKSWPPALRARLRGTNRIIDGRPEDPGGHGARNDALRWSPWR